MKLNQKSGAKIAMTAAALVVSGTALIASAFAVEGIPGTLLRRQRLRRQGRLQDHQERLQGQECLQGPRLGRDAPGRVQGPRRPVPGQLS